jgi:ferritin-like metal-binding protein YciE
MILATIRSFLVESLRKVSAVERQIAWGLPRVLGGVSSQELKSVVQEYLSETESHCERFEKIWTSLGEAKDDARCFVSEAFTREAIAISERRGDERILDLAIMSVLRQMVHFEKSSYEIVRSIAEVCGERGVVEVVDEILTETEHTERSFILLTEDMMDSIAAKSEERFVPHIRTSTEGPVSERRTR